MKALTVVLFFGACVLLYFGSGMLLVVPSYRGESYFSTGRILYGVLPTVLCGVLLTIVGWLWTRTGSRIGLRKAIVKSFCLAFASIGLLWLILLVIARVKEG